VKKITRIYGSHTGSTTEATIAPIRVDDKTEVSGGIYKIKKGYKFAIYELDFSAEGETMFWIEVSPDAGTTWHKSKPFKLASKGHLSRSYRFPYIIEAIDKEYHLRVRYIQPVAKSVYFALHGELRELKE